MPLCLFFFTSWSIPKGCTISSCEKRASLLHVQRSVWLSCMFVEAVCEVYTGDLL